MEDGRPPPCEVPAETLMAKPTCEADAASCAHDDVVREDDTIVGTSIWRVAGAERIEGTGREPGRLRFADFNPNAQFVVKPR